MPTAPDPTAPITRIKTASRLPAFIAHFPKNRPSWAGTIIVGLRFSGIYIPNLGVGFSRSGKTCGFLHVPATADGRVEPEAVALTFGKLVAAVVELARQHGPPLHLALEAPCLPPSGPMATRWAASSKNKRAGTRYWYAGHGCSVLVASLYLLKAVAEGPSCTRNPPVRGIRFFQG